MTTAYETVFASIDNYRKGGVECLNEDPKRYVFSNMYEVAATNKPYDRIVVAKNLDYAMEVCRAEGSSDWMACAHDEFVIAMDYDVVVHYLKLADDTVIDRDKDGFQSIKPAPEGQKMGRIFLKRGHQALLPENTAYSFHADKPATLLIQTIVGDESIEKWAEICQH